MAPAPVRAPSMPSAQMAAALHAQAAEKLRFLRPIPRVNGWSWPLNVYQCVSWVNFLILTVTTLGIFIPFVYRDLQISAYVLIGGLFLFHLVTNLIAATIDPAEATVRYKKNYLDLLPTFDRSKHEHVIQNEYCHLCKVIVGKTSKHCSACNKCVTNFDHHCKWLNNCIGSRNYWFFFSSVTSALVGLVCVLAIDLYVFIRLLLDSDGLLKDARLLGFCTRVCCFQVGSPPAGAVCRGDSGGGSLMELC
ncbi:probable palmitoyltransferase ZDHHC11 [Otolemur garnettii]|uniref:probable palmitoyltransferase ZDHHC11 n=1 Tax=Otolemur garnettii TaxID=30611 RepID=UPI0006446CCC|nr:probable palmitoyltransferase ZDHHC11 [Otolemur garnettii]